MTGTLDGRFDGLVGDTDPAMVIVTAAHEGERAGCLVGFHSQASIEPRRYCLWLSKANHTTRVALRTTHLAVHPLSVDDGDLAELFGTTTGDEVDKLARCEWVPSDEGPPLLTDVPGRMVVRRVTLLDEGGDHLCVVTEPVRVDGVGPATPLRLSDVRHLAPGHGADDRPSPPTERAG